MNEMLWTANVREDRYVELVKERDRLRKEAFLCRQEYIRIFGEQILKVFEKKVECIRKKKMIAYCQAAINRGEAIDRIAMQAYLAKAMKKYCRQLDEMAKENEEAQNGGRVTQAELMRIKRIYHRIAKRIHPDIFPHTQEEPLLTELWNRTSAAYACNDLETLMQCELLVKRALEELGIDAEPIDIPDIEEKITALEAEILKIRETDPYQYKYLLADEAAVAKKWESLNEELKSYEDYDEQLEEMLAEVMGNGGVIVWQMN